MKKLYIALSMNLLCCVSCLDEHPRDRISPEQAFDTPTHIYLNTVGTLYSLMGSDADSQGLQGTYRGIYDYNTFTTDEAMIPRRGGDWYDGGFWERLYTQQWRSDDSELYATWSYLYKVVVLSNDAIRTLNTYRSRLTAEQHRAYTAEARAIRAMYYYYLVDMFGNVPLLDKPEVKVSDVKKAKRSDVFLFAFNELQAVCDDLPDARSNAEGLYYGRITRPVVYFLLAKLALNAEVYTCNHPAKEPRRSGSAIYFTVDGTQMNAWQTVIHYCNQITAAGYRLETDYAGNFAIHNETSQENIFTLPMDKNLYTTQYQYLFRSRNYHHGRALGLGAENGACATISTVKAFGYGTPNVDTRYALNFYSDTITVDGDTVRLDNGQPLVYQPLAVALDLTYSKEMKTAGARMKKYEIDRKAYLDGKLQDNDIVLYRYADVLLMLAEAKVRNGESGDDALTAVRHRAGMPPRAATLDNILEERLLELVWEGWRRQDLIRFNRFNKSISGSSTDKSLFPIPQNAIDLNPNLR
ncbi:MAG: RagB/SusD family nutrient uptake outer membrane protein [Hoylesella marshii]|uniref:RagB/SusD family nutrient uptake outer membrane protein n=1 Tax=Hoylesella marshii TaxID=189722 RepID=UPI003FA04FF0